MGAARRAGLAALLALGTGGFAACAPGGTGTGASPDGRPVVTLAEYRRLQPRMLYRNVVAVLGAPGRRLPDGDLRRPASLDPGVPLQGYAWENPDGSSLSALFEDGQLVWWSQSGLQ